VYNTEQNSSDNFSSYPPQNHQSTDDVYWRTGGDQMDTGMWVYSERKKSAQFRELMGLEIID